MTDPADDTVNDEETTASWRDRILPTLLGVLLAAVVVTAASLVYDRFTQHDETPPAAADIGPAGPRGLPLGVDAVRAARRATLDFFALDFRRPAAAGRSLRSFSTAEFRQQYDTQIGPLQSRVASGRLVLTPQVPSGGIATEYLSDHTARILVAVDVTTRSMTGRRDTTPYAVRVSLQRDAQRWLVAGIDEVS